MFKALTRRLGGGTPRSSSADEERVTGEAGGTSGKKFRLSDFELHETLGTGTFGRVRMVRHLKTGAYYALKISKKAAIIRMKQVEHVKNEVSLLAQIDHPNVVNMLGHFQDETRLYLVMEYVEGGELFSHLRSAVRFSDHQGMIYAGEIVLAFTHLHSLNIIYRDLKPENLLITREGRIKITDFGFAKVVEDRTWTLCGTPEYLAPEIIQSHGHGKGVDWWALGVLVHELLAGYPPFYDENPLGIYQKILAGHVDPPSTVGPKPRDLIKKLLVIDRTKRLGCIRGGGKAVQEHKWFEKLDWEALFAGRIEAPFVPRVKGAGDTSNFETYPESTDERTQSLTAEERRIFQELDSF
ncbi:camp-dependent protein kinase catalytic subunit [Tribonema minus]|uniref:Camp-dependent protein kinase catalytic subunit n=1 Tax=Tribonema minus TaxID=303371 RepID=A0A836CMT7_9STRA|nr:camp-dependent protein kinase catalytic subunit [Tribonema minus]